MPTFLEPPEMPLPRAKRAMATRSGLRRPKMLAIWPKRGWGTVVAKRNEFATQTYFSAPPISRAIVGRDVVMMVASTADMKDSKQRAENMHQMRQDLVNA